MERWSLNGKVALVTGASSGLSAHYASVLATAGADVIVAARRESVAHQIRDSILAAGRKCRTACLGVVDGTTIAALRPLLDEADILVNSAGVVRDATALDQSAVDWDAIIDTNLKAMFLMSQACAR